MVNTQVKAGTSPVKQGGCHPGRRAHMQSMCLIGSVSSALSSIALPWIPKHWPTGPGSEASREVWNFPVTRGQVRDIIDPIIFVKRRQVALLTSRIS